MKKLTGINKKNIAVFISGTGSNLKSLIKYSNLKNSNLTIKLIVSSNKNANGLGYAKKNKIPYMIANFKVKKNSENKIFRYPDPESNALKKEISKKYKLNQNNVICGNGSDEILATVAKIFSGPGDEILYSEYGFLMYPIASQLAGAKGIKVKDINYKNSIKNSDINY